MKRIFYYITAFALIILLAISLTACDPMSYSIGKTYLTDNIVGVELIYYENPGQESFRSWVPNHYSKLVSFNLSNMTILETLDGSELETFLEQLSKVEFLAEYYTYDSPQGTCIRLLYANGDFIILSCNYEYGSFAGYVGRYNSKGDVTGFIGSFSGLQSFTSLVNNFFETQLS